MAQVQISPDVALRETMIESEQRRNRVLVLAQQLADAQAENAQLKEQIAVARAPSRDDERKTREQGDD